MGRVHQHNTSVADRFMVAKPVLEARYARAGLGGSVLVTPTEVCATPEPVRNFRVLFNSFFLIAYWLLTTMSLCRVCIRVPNTLYPSCWCRGSVPPFWCFSRTCMGYLWEIGSARFCSSFCVHSTCTYVFVGIEWCLLCQVCFLVLHSRFFYHGVVLYNRESSRIRPCLIEKPMIYLHIAPSHTL